MGAVGRKRPNSKGSSDDVDPKSEQLEQTGRNKPADAALSAVKAAKSAQQVERSAPPEQLSLNIQWALQIARSKYREQVEANKQQYRQEQGQQSLAEYKAQIQAWMDSGDPVLVTEAERILSKMAQTSGAHQRGGQFEQ